MHIMSDAQVTGICVDPQYSCNYICPKAISIIFTRTLPIKEFEKVNIIVTHHFKALIYFLILILFEIVRRKRITTKI